MKVGDKVRVVKSETPDRGWDVVAHCEGVEGVITNEAYFDAPLGEPNEGWDVTLDNDESWTFLSSELEVI